MCNLDVELPLLSVAIPTRNRLDYVKYSIQSILRIPSPRLQLVIEDNSDSNDLEVWLRDNIYDSRLVYRYSSSPVSMCENYDRAMSLATGEYVCLIGDDDGVVSEIVEATVWAKKNSIDALVPSSLINYVWPDLQMTSRSSMEAGELTIRPFTGEVYFPNPEAEMLKCVQDAGQNFHKLPKAYYGIVKRECMDLVKERTGSYFPGVSPDMSAAISIATVARRVCYVNYPLFVPGSSARSNAGLSGLKKHIGWLRDQPHLPITCERDWSDIVPLFYSVQTIWAEATVNSLRATGRVDVLCKFNVPLLYAICSVFHYRYMLGNIGRFFYALHILGQGRIVGASQFVYWFCYWWCLRIKSLILRLSGKGVANKAFCKKGLRSIDEAVISVAGYLEKSGVLFRDVFN